MLKKISFAIALTTVMLSATAFAIDVDPDLPSYEPVSGISGNLKSVGSDTFKQSYDLMV